MFSNWHVVFCHFSRAPIDKKPIKTKSVSIHNHLSMQDHGVNDLDGLVLLIFFDDDLVLRDNDDASQVVFSAFNQQTSVILARKLILWLPMEGREETKERIVRMIEFAKKPNPKGLLWMWIFYENDVFAWFHNVCYTSVKSCRKQKNENCRIRHLSKFSFEWVSVRYPALRSCWENEKTIAWHLKKNVFAWQLHHVVNNLMWWSLLQITRILMKCCSCCPERMFWVVLEPCSYWLSVPEQKSFSNESIWRLWKFTLSKAYK